MPTITDLPPSLCRIVPSYQVSNARPAFRRGKALFRGGGSCRGGCSSGTDSRHGIETRHISQGCRVRLWSVIMFGVGLHCQWSAKFLGVFSRMENDKTEGCHFGTSHQTLTARTSIGKQSSSPATANEVYSTSAAERLSSATPEAESDNIIMTISPNSADPVNRYLDAYVSAYRASALPH